MRTGRGGGPHLAADRRCRPNALLTSPGRRFVPVVRTPPVVSVALGRLGGRSIEGFAVRAFTGVFETHLTVLPPSRGDEVVRWWARRYGMKYTRIMLERGGTPDQPMLSYRGSGELAGQWSRAREWVERLREAGIRVTRVKIEAAPWNADVPQTAREAAELPPECMFEHHVKLVLSGDAQVAEVRELGRPHGAHVSWNARRAVAGGRHERFVTQRCRRVGRSEARRRLTALLDDLARAGYPAVEVEEEFVVHDDNPAVDAGWDSGLETRP